MTEKTRVSICVPLGETVPSMFFLSINKLIFGNCDDYQLFLYSSCSKPLDLARNNIVLEALSQNESDYILFLDTDMVFDKNLLKKLLAHKKEVVSALYFTKYYPYEATARKFLFNTGMVTFQKYQDIPLKSGLVPSASGLGACLIEASVFDKIDHPYFKFEFADHGKEGGLGIKTGEDIYFFRKVIQAGITPYVDTDIILRHLGGVGSGLESFEHGIKKEAKRAEEANKKFKEMRDRHAEELPVMRKEGDTLPQA